MTAPSTLPAVLLERADAAPRQVASRTLRGGYWQETGWAETLHQTARIADVLRGLGVTKDSVVVLVTSARREWPLAVWATQSLGAIVLAVRTDADASSLDAVGSSHTCALWIVEGEEQFDKVQSINASHCPILVIEPRGVSLDAESRVVAWPTDLQADTDVVAAFRSAVADLDPDSPAAIIPVHAASSDGPVGIWTHRQLIETFGVSGATGPGLTGDDEYLSFLPPAWMIEQRAVLLDGPMNGAVVSFGGQTGGVLADLQAVQPTVVKAPAEFWSALAADVEARMEDAGGFSLSTYRSAVRHGRRAGQHGIRWWLVFRPLLTKIGLRRVRLAVTIEPVDGTVRDYFASLGITLEPMATPPVGQDGESVSESLEHTRPTTPRSQEPQVQ